MHFLGENRNINYNLNCSYQVNFDHRMDFNKWHFLSFSLEDVFETFSNNEYHRNLWRYFCFNLEILMTFYSSLPRCAVRILNIHLKNFVTYEKQYMLFYFVKPISLLLSLTLLCLLSAIFLPPLKYLKSNIIIFIHLVFLHWWVIVDKISSTFSGISMN
jgi:hypothetical protein